MKINSIINVHTHFRKHNDIDAKVTFWRKCGCEKVCVHVTGMTEDDVRHSNKTLLPWLKKYPDFLLGFALPKLGWKPSIAEDVDKFKEQGFFGLKFIAPSYPYDSEKYFPLYERAEKLNMPVLFHTGIMAQCDNQRELGISQDKMRAIRLDTIARAFIKLRIMLAHLGGPEFNMGLDLIMSFSNIWGDFSGDSGSERRFTTLMKHLAPLPGADMSDPMQNLALDYFKKLCFATDNPDPPVWIDLSKRLMDRLEIPLETRECFWKKNAQDWLGIP